jgi:hypothetical protein
MEVTADGVILEVHLHMDDGQGCTFFDLERTAPVRVDYVSNGGAGGGDVTLTGGASLEACDAAPPSSSGPIEATVFLTLNADSRVPATGTITFDSGDELQFTATRT